MRTNNLPNPSSPPRVDFIVPFAGSAPRKRHVPPGGGEPGDAGEISLSDPGPKKPQPGKSNSRKNHQVSTAKLLDQQNRHK